MKPNTLESRPSTEIPALRRTYPISCPITSAFRIRSGEKVTRITSYTYMYIIIATRYSCVVRDRFNGSKSWLYLWRAPHTQDDAPHISLYEYYTQYSRARYIIIITITAADNTFFQTTPTRVTCQPWARRPPFSNNPRRVA